VRKVLLVLVVSGFTLEAAIYAGPLSSGALWLLLADGDRAVAHDPLSSLKALHKGGVHRGTGLYIRDDEDLIVQVQATGYRESLASARRTMVNCTSSAIPIDFSGSR
jgi:hypothetical protein